MKHIVYRFKDDSVLIYTPGSRQQANIEQCQHDRAVRDLDPSEWSMEIKTTEELTSICGDKNEDCSNQWYYEGNELKHDDDFETRLMSLPLIHKKQTKRLLEEMKTVSEPVRAVQLMAEKEEWKEHLRNRFNKPKEIYQKALDNLVKENKKPQIQEKLRAKINAG